MKTKHSSILLSFLTGLILVIITSCGPAALPPLNETPTPGTTFELLATPNNADTPIPLITSDNLTAAIPSNTPPTGVTIIPSVGDLGWGSVYGKITDGVTGLPIEGATVTCQHSSYTSPYLCNAVTTTNREGIYSFNPVFFHDTDRIVLIVEAPGYAPLHFEQTSFTLAEFHADLGLFPWGYVTQTPTPFLMCTPPVCAGGVLVCGVTPPSGTQASACVGGCGTICLPLTPTP